MYYSIISHVIWGVIIIIENENKDNATDEKGGKNMAVSMAVIPTLRGKAANSVLQTLNASRIKPYSKEARSDAERVISEILQKRDNK